MDDDAKSDLKETKAEGKAKVGAAKGDVDGAKEILDNRKSELKSLKTEYKQKMSTKKDEVKLAKRRRNTTASTTPSDLWLGAR